MTIIFDKISLLRSLGDSASAVASLARRMEKAITDAEDGSRLVTLATRKEEDDRLCDHLARNCDLLVRVWPLSSGRCWSVSGNVSHVWRTEDRRKGRFQFKVEDKKGVTVFALGASKAVL